MAQSLPMNGGDGKYSYTKNSTLQRHGASIVKTAMKEALFENLDLEKLFSGSTSATFAIADLGCSVGPNTFTAMQTIIETVEHKLNHEQRKHLEFQVMFNDQTANDFNTLFASLPHPRPYFAAAVPGSFHGRLFPSSSIHIAYSAYALHWLSKLPEELQVKDSPTWNAGRIHYVGASDAVVKAYADEFEAEMEIFLRARGEEIVGGGMIVMVMTSLSVPEGGNEHESILGIVVSFLESIFMEMVEEGVLEQEKVDSFNFPMMYPCMEGVRRVIERNGCFEIVKMELGDIPLATKGDDGDVDFERFLVQYRAVAEGTYANHFGKEMIDQLFTRAMQQNLKCTHIWRSRGAMTTTTHLFAALKRKY